MTGIPSKHEKHLLKLKNKQHLNLVFRNKLLYLLYYKTNKTFTIMRKGILSTAPLCTLTLASSCQRHETNALNQESLNYSATEAYVDACATLVLNLSAAIENKPKPLTSFTDIDSLSARVYDNLSIEAKSNLLNNPLTFYPETRATDEKMMFSPSSAIEYASETAANIN